MNNIGGPMANNYIKDVFKDVLKHTHGLGILKW